ncbi:hypothetical protein KZO01_06090 [Kurthia zopfii]|uniref:Uncharacterized protein n=1 Tax=Kurthia zopfii TaxID=1650 RepID=A0A8B4Q730_9BACL|nr:hypothetical protein [Kurthia zopfii]PWI23521.1 hypothetical protein DF281_02970 [Kurthia zopfii]TDR35549.1 hypothetical protein DFR61_13044 [Kurthia zopfii]GEK30300.1 hypothetical protein KZO01_06090 [Kurthia zopfii]STX09189.1 Uncharacterised protein [Kurthia zopfii]
MLEKFRADDAQKAQWLYDSAEDTLAEIQTFLKAGHYAAAEIATEELHDNINQIRMLSKAKKDHDRLAKLAKSLKGKNVKAEVISFVSTQSI